MRDSYAAPVLYSKMHMRFAIDAHAIGRKLTGNETYVRSLLREYPSLEPDTDWIAYTCDPQALRNHGWSRPIKTVSSNPFRRLGWDLPRLIAQDRPDMVHVQYTAPLLCNAPVVVTVHDVSYLEHPEFFSRARRTQLQITVQRTVESAAKIIAPSEFSRQRILSVYNLPAENVVTVPEAAAISFRPVARDTATRHARKLLGFKDPFVLCVGDLRRRKNQPALIRAFAEVLRRHPNLKHRLVLAGKQAEPEAAFRAAEESGVRDRIHFTGFVPDEALLHLYNACDVFTTTSLYEGFGLPILEAMACGAPVACSNLSAMPEVADSAAILFDPRQHDEIVLGLRDLLLNPELRQRMGRLGLQRAALFSWRRTAQQTLDVYHEVAGSRRPVPVRDASVTV